MHVSVGLYADRILEQAPLSMRDFNADNCQTSQEAWKVKINPMPEVSEEQVGKTEILILLSTSEAQNRYRHMVPKVNITGPLAGL